MPSHPVGDDAESLVVLRQKEVIFVVVPGPAHVRHPDALQRQMIQTGGDSVHRSGLFHVKVRRLATIAHRRPSSPAASYPFGPIPAERERPS